MYFLSSITISISKHLNFSLQFNYQFCYFFQKKIQFKYQFFNCKKKSFNFNINYFQQPKIGSILISNSNTAFKFFFNYDYEYFEKAHNWPFEYPFSNNRRGLLVVNHNSNLFCMSFCKSKAMSRGI